MNVLLVNSNREHMPWPTVPLGLCIVASALDRAGHRVSVLDLAFTKRPRQAVERHARALAPDLVGVTVRNIDNCNFERPVFYLEEIRDSVIAAVRRARPTTPIVIGGSGVNVAPRDTLRYLGADYAIVGEGEEAIGALADALEHGASLDAVPGLLRPDGGTTEARVILDTGRHARGEPPSGRALAQDFCTSVRSHAWRWVDLERYASLGAPYPIQSKRGCNQRCSYCVYNQLEGREFRLREPREVVDEIAYVVRWHGVRRVDFVDSTFNMPLRHALELCEELARRALPVELSTMGLNPAALTADLLSLMRRAGFANVMCTPESASDTTLATLAKGFNRQTLVRAARLLRDAGLPTYWFFMFGAPGETMHTVRETLSFCEEHIAPTDMVLFTTGIRVHAGTPLERHCKDSGWFVEDDPLFEPSWYVSPELDLQELYALLVGAAAAHPNWMTNAETVLDPTRAAIMKRVFSALGWGGVFWQHLPRLFRFAGRSRRKGFERQLRALRAISTPDEVAHRRPSVVSR